MSDTAGGESISAVLLTVPYDEDAQEQIRRSISPADLVVVDSRDGDAVRRALMFVDVALVASDIDDSFLAAPKLRWIHCGHAGIERSSRLELLRRGVLISGSAGRSSPVLAEHVFFLMLSLLYDVRGLLRAQQSHQWGMVDYSSKRGLYGRTIGILGLGATGRELVSRAQAFNMNVIAYRRRDIAAEGVSRLLVADRGDSLTSLFTDSDFVVACLRLSDETYRMISAREFELMGPSSFFINIARGGIVDEAAMLAALRAGVIAGAGLDNFEEEPLPPESPFWDLPNVIITPHATPQMPDRTERTLSIALENIRRYRSGEPLLNAVTERDHYTPRARPVSR